MAEENAEDMIRKERLERLYKKLFLVIAIIAFCAIIKLTFIATKDMALDVAINCEFEISESEGYVFNRIRNVEDAQDVMAEHTDENFTFIKFILEPCGDGGGSAYYFNTSAHTYRLCEEGTMQKFVEVCGTRGFTGKMLISTVEFLDIVL